MVKTTMTIWWSPEHTGEEYNIYCIVGKYFVHIVVIYNSGNGPLLFQRGKWCHNILSISSVGTGMVPDNTVHLIHICYWYLLPNFRLIELFPPLVCHTYVQFCTQILVIFLRYFLAANFSSLPQKVDPHAQHQPVHHLPSH